MFNGSYFGVRYFCTDYFNKVGSGATVIVVTGSSGGAFRSGQRRRTQGGDI